MRQMEKKQEKLIANNKKAYHDYFILDTYEAGISLAGTEVKSLRMGKCSIKEAFIRIENEVNAGIETDKHVIATGGSVIYGEEAMNHFREIGTVVYLKLSYPTICSRLGNIRRRGVVLKDGQTLKDLYDERIPLYEKYADVIVDAEGYDIEGLMDEVVHELQKITEFE